MRLRESGDSPTCCELSWGPGGSVGFLFEFFRVFRLTIVMVKGREVCAQVTHCIEPDLRRPSDHAPLIVDLPIAPENICVRRMVLKRDSEEEIAFLLSVSEGLSQLNFSSLDFTTGLDLLSEAISRLFANCWATYAKKNTVTTWSKKW